MKPTVRKVLVSGCLGGAKIRFNATCVDMHDAIWRKWEQEGRLYHFCPEIAAGFGIPRPPAEIANGTAADVVEGRAKVIEDSGADVTGPFLRGAELAVEVATREGVVAAVLTDGSPSCGSTYQFSGNFDGQTKPGRGVVAELLFRAGVKVFPHTDLEAAHIYLRKLES